MCYANVKTGERKKLLRKKKSLRKKFFLKVMRKKLGTLFNTQLDNCDG